MKINKYKVGTNRKRILQYPALVNCTSIDWFCEWPREALLEVAERYLDGLELGSLEGVRNADTHTLTFRVLILIKGQPIKVEGTGQTKRTPTSVNNSLT